MTNIAPHSFTRARQRMVETQLVQRGIKDARVLHAMQHVYRHEFTGLAIASQAYQDSALPIGEGQTISQPYMVARMCELLNLKGHERVLEIGTGCGYHTAVLATLCSRVYSIERIPTLHKLAKDNLRRIKQHNIILKCDDGLLGWHGFSPFDAIIVTAGGMQSKIWMEQLTPEGILLMPEGKDGQHQLMKQRLENGRTRKVFFDACTFVPLLQGVRH